MGIGYANAKKLIQLAARQGGLGPRVLMLGRHRFGMKEKFKPIIDAQLKAAGFDVTVADVGGGSGYAEPFLQALGAKQVDTLDLSDFEGAGILHDLNDPVDKSLAGKFDLIIDGGTTEHVFDVARCMDNLNVLTADGGTIMSCVPANNWFAHGFYQFGPELVYGYWKHGCGFDVQTCCLLPVLPRDSEVPIPDPAAVGRRPRLRGRVPKQRSYLYYEVVKGPTAHRYTRALQTDYVRKWSDFDTSQERTASDVVALRLRQREAAREMAGEPQ